VNCPSDKRLTCSAANSSSRRRRATHVRPASTSERTIESISQTSASRQRVEGPNFVLRYGKCRQVQVPIAVNQRGVQIKCCKANLTYERWGLCAGGAVSIDDTVSGDPDHMLFELQKETRCTLHVLWKRRSAVMPIDRRAYAQSEG
jgi:hypothetical protein